MGDECHVRFIFWFYMENTWTFVKGTFKILHRHNLAFVFGGFTQGRSCCHSKGLYYLTGELKVKEFPLSLIKGKAIVLISWFPRY